MADRTTDGFELDRALRDLYADRDPGHAPETLYRRIGELTATATRGRRAQGKVSFRSLLSGAAAATLVVVGGTGAILATLGGWHRPGPGGGVPTPVPFDIERTGIGIVPAADATGPWLLALLGAAACLAVARTRRQRARRFALVTAAAFLAVPVGLSSIPGPAFGLIYGPGQGLTSAEDTLRPGVFHVTAGPGQPFSFLTGVHNEGPLPITVRGLVDASGPVTWTALWLDRERVGAAGPAFPFTPVTIDPMQDTSDMPLPGDTEAYSLWAVGKGGAACTEPPGVPHGRGEPGDAGPSVSITAIRVAWTVMGWPRDSLLELPMTIELPLVEGCVPPDEVR